HLDDRATPPVAVRIRNVLAGFGPARRRRPHHDLSRRQPDVQVLDWASFECAFVQSIAPRSSKAVIPGLDPGIWCSFWQMAGSSPAMTNEGVGAALGGILPFQATRDGQISAADRLGA